MIPSSPPSGNSALPKPLTVHLIAAARPNFMKIAPLYHSLAR
jgi:hypothetical protein